MADGDKKKDEVMEEEGEEVKMRRMAETTAASLNSFSPLVLQGLLPENVAEKHRTVNYRW